MTNPPAYRDERPNHRLNAQEQFWTGPRFIALLVATLAVAIGVIVTAANASY